MSIGVPAKASSSFASSLPLVEELRIEPLGAFDAVRSLPYALFLDSALRHPTLGRYSYVAADPFAVLRSRREVFSYQGLLFALQADPLQVLAEVLGGTGAFRKPGAPPTRFEMETVAGLPPFQGGVAGLFGYDLCHHIERLPRPRFDEFQTFDLALGFYDWVYAYDHAEERGWLISSGFPENAPAARAQRAHERLRFARQILQDRQPRRDKQPACPAPPRTSWQLVPTELAPQFSMPQLPGLRSNFNREQFLSAIRRAIEYVHAGDCFQVNIAQRLLYPLREHPAALYLRLREVNPATFAGYFDLGECVIASASPERFLKLDNSGRVETRPIKGTRPRGRTPVEDEAQAAALAHSSKDRAENVMIVDLLRNDLGRVCEYGSIHVPSLCQVESYQTVHHLVSVVEGKLRPEKGAVDLLRAAFPGGSVTGAPKVRAMEIIAELEPTARGPYCGSLGFVGFNGAMDTSILIRTFTASKGWLQFPVGGGIVADSDPQREYEETLHKAEGLLRALA